MAFARQLVRGDRVELARLRRGPAEPLFGAQVATNSIDELCRAAALAQAQGADFVDLNCGCPIREATRRGLGSRLLRKPAKLGRLCREAAERSPLPVTVKVRLGGDHADDLAKLATELASTGVAAVAVHGRTAAARYKRPADWDSIASAAAAWPPNPSGTNGGERGGHATATVGADDTAAAPAGIAGAGPGLFIIGNGDVLTPWEASARLATPGIRAVLVGRGALVRPWLFRESGGTGGDGDPSSEQLDPTARDRVSIYRDLVGRMKDHFGRDARGRDKAWYFLPWHFDWLCRYRPTPEDVWGVNGVVVRARRGRMEDGDGEETAGMGYRPLLGLRELAEVALGEWDPNREPTDPAYLDPLERILRTPSAEGHAALAAILWESTTDAEAIDALTRLGRDRCGEWEAEAKRSGGSGHGAGGRDDDNDEKGGGAGQTEENERGGRGPTGRRADQARECGGRDDRTAGDDARG